MYKIKLTDGQECDCGNNTFHLQDAPDEERQSLGGSELVVAMCTHCQDIEMIILVPSNWVLINEKKRFGFWGNRK